MKEVTVKRDNYANLRTHLANERTLLSFIRTFLALVGFGILLIKYESTVMSLIIENSLIVIAVIVIIVGIVRFFTTKKNINTISNTNIE